MVDPSEQTERNRAEQQRLYGSALGDIFTDLTATFGISRGRLAQVLGLSAPMVSQLSGGHRLKIGNPAAVQRLQRLMETAPEVRSGAMTADAALDRITAEDAGAVLTRTTGVQRRQGAQDVQRVLRWAASAEEITRAADLLSAEFPALSEVLRVYGTGRSTDAAAHFERLAVG